MNSIFIKTFGCQMNIYDSNKILNILYKEYKTIKVKNPEKADIILLNTCSIRKKSEEKMFSDLGRVKKIKKYKPNLIICIGGCVSTKESEKILKRAPYVNIIFSPKNFFHLPKMIKKYIKTKNVQIKINNLNKKKNNIINTPISGITSYISIMEGCNRNCSYCIVPQTRGREESRNLNKILKEIKNLSNKGTKEIILLGQNINSFYEKKNKKILGISYLIKKIENIKKIKRIRFMSSHPKGFQEEIINAYKENSKLVNHIYLPIQHGSNKILKLMKRGYSVEEYKSIIKKLRKIRPNISISSDFIIGFPGETKKDFKKLIKLIKKIKFDISYVFIFSPRPGTLAATFKNNLSNKTKKKRFKKIQNILKKNIKNISKKMVGTIQKVLVEKTNIKNLKSLIGKTENNRLVNFTSNIQRHLNIGNIVNVKITNFNTYYLTGEMLNT